MDKRLNFLYDHQADVLNISTGHPIYTDSIPLDENIILHLEPSTQEIVGFSIIDFIKRFANRREPSTVPLVATFERFGSSTKRKRPTHQKSITGGE